MQKNNHNLNLESDKWHRLERKLDRYNHLMELMRTVLGVCTLTLQVVILMKLFGVI
jgi:hypothetical protein